MPFMPTADLCDSLGDDARVVADLGFRDFGKRRSFSGPVATVVAPQDNSMVKAVLQEEGKGRILVVQGFGARERALLGGNLGVLAVRNGWAGVVINGCVRDCVELAECDIGIRALGPSPRKTDKRDAGERDVVVEIGGVRIRPGEWLCADEDGIVVCETEPR